MICSKCGYKNKKGSKFCNECGEKLPAEPVIEAEVEVKNDLGVAEFVLNERLRPKKYKGFEKLNKIFIYIELGLLSLAILFTALSFISDKTLMIFIIIGSIFYLILFITWISHKIIRKNHLKKTA